MHYQRLMTLGSGGMAHVHLCLAVGHGGFKRLAVVKSVREELLGEPSMRQMFLAEARLSARLNHPNVVQVSEVVETDDGVMLVMEHLDGLSFAAACRTAGDALTRPMRLRVICDVLSGLAYAHDLTDYHGQPLGIVHRDVSAQNVFVTFDGRVKLLDFGIAKVTSAPDRTRTGVIKGRLAYMPVEQITGEPLDRRTDVYAMGCLLWDAIAGSRMWGALSDAQIIRNVMKGQVPRLSTRVEVDPELERIVTKATAQAAADRYATADELRLDLERYLSTLPPVTSRDVGELLARISAEARATRKRELAEAIAVAERELSLQGVDVDGSSQRRLNFDDPTRRSGISPKASIATGSTPNAYLHVTPSSTMTVSDGSKSRSSRRRRQRELGLALGGAAILAIAAWIPSSFKQSPPALAPSAAAPSSVAAPSTPATARVDVQAHGEPTREVSAATAAPTPESVEPAPAAKSKRAAAHLANATAVPAPNAKPGATRADCSPPYYFSGGIKTFKPECI